MPVVPASSGCDAGSDTDRKMRPALSEAAPGGWGPSSDPGATASSPGAEDGPQPPGGHRRGADVSSHPYERLTRRRGAAEGEGSMTLDEITGAAVDANE